MDKLRLNKGIKGIETVMYSDISGTPFIFKDFKSGVLILDSGEEYEAYVRYDIFADEIHLKDKNQIFAIIQPERVKMITTDSIKFIYSEYVRSPGKKDPDDTSYFIVRKDGKCMLLIRKNIRIQDPEPAKILQEPKPALFVHKKDTYYLRTKDNHAVQIRSKKDLLSVLDDRNDEVNRFIKSIGGNVKKIEDLEAIIDYYNNL